MTASDAGNDQSLDSDGQSRTRRKRLSGLARIWIVVSVSWLVGESLFLWYQIDNRMDQYTHAAYSTCENKFTIPPNLLLKHLDSIKMSAESLFTDDILTRYWLDLSLIEFSAKDSNDSNQILTLQKTWKWPLEPLLIILLAPILLFWLFVYGPIRWIVHGFQD
jgi:hypothetical protein